MKSIGILLVLLLLGMGVSSALSEETPIFHEAAVHDPSIIRAEDGTYYIYGSHMAAAKSADLMRWEMISYSTAECTLVDDVYTEMADALSWAKTDTFWAGDVQRLADGRYYLYYCTCVGDAPLSALGLAVSDSPEGPFEDLGVFLRSGMSGIGEDGARYDATVHPNAIDPHTFYDAQGKLWMVYGSYSGGFFILEMDDATGLPLPGQGYGRKLLGKNHSRIEGPYILYSPDTEYYYLFLSFGGLLAGDGYNIRVARSRTPDGPYVDSAGQDMIGCGGADGTFFDDEAIAPFGVKLMGGFRFMPLEGEEKLAEAAYRSPGHNSAYYDEETGRYFLIFHTRFSALGEEFRVRVHQFWFNEDGWPVVAPFRYAGETIGESDAQAQAGHYRLIRHGRDVNRQQNRSVEVTLAPDGTVSGEWSGTWRASGGYGCEIELGDASFSGVFVRAYDVQQKGWTMTLTALSEVGEALWGTQTVQ